MDNINNIIDKNIEKLLEIYNNINPNEEKEIMFYNSKLKTMKNRFTDFIKEEDTLDNILQDTSLCPRNELGKYTTECDKGYDIKHTCCAACWASYLRTDWSKENEQK